MRHQSISAPIRVLVTDDTRVHTELLADALKRDGGLQVTTSPSGSEGLIGRPDLHDVDVLLLSSTLDGQPGRGFDVLRGLHSSHAYVRAVMLLDSSKQEAIVEAFCSGARGVLGRHESVDIFGKCVRRVHEGQIWANSEQTVILAQALGSSHTLGAVDSRGKNLLSRREMDIVRSVAQGLTNREIAERFELSPHTIKNCLFRVFDKLGVANRVELLLMTMRQHCYAQSALLYFLDDYGDAMRDEATLVACQRAAEQGVLMAQLALAQFHASRRKNAGDALDAYQWYSVARERISQALKEATKTMTVDQVIQAEQMTARQLDNGGKAPSMCAKDEARHRRSTTKEEAFEKPVG